MTGARARQVLKVRTGIRGFDAIRAGGLPRERAKLALGAAGTGKTLLGLEVLARAPVAT